MPKVSNHPIGENSPNLVTLKPSLIAMYVCTYVLKALQRDVAALGFLAAELIERPNDCDKSSGPSKVIHFAPSSATRRCRKK
jgi:hypothetical protein